MCLNVCLYGLYFCIHKHLPIDFPFSKLCLFVGETNTFSATTNQSIIQLIVIIINSGGWFMTTVGDILCTQCTVDRCPQRFAKDGKKSIHTHPSIQSKQPDENP